MKPVNYNKLNGIVAFGKRLEITNESCLGCPVDKNECDIWKMKRKSAETTVIK